MALPQNYKQVALSANMVGGNREYTFLYSLFNFKAMCEIVQQAADFTVLIKFFNTFYLKRVKVYIKICCLLAERMRAAGGSGGGSGSSVSLINIYNFSYDEVYNANDIFTHYNGLGGGLFVFIISFFIPFFHLQAFSLNPCLIFGTTVTVSITERLAESFHTNSPWTSRLHSTKSRQEYCCEFWSLCLWIDF